MIVPNIFGGKSRRILNLASRGAGGLVRDVISRAPCTRKRAELKGAEKCLFRAKYQKSDFVFSLVRFFKWKQITFEVCMIKPMANYFTPIDFPPPI